MLEPDVIITIIITSGSSSSSIVAEVLLAYLPIMKETEALLMFNPKAWKTHKSLLVEEYLITCRPHDSDDGFAIGARYKVAFSRRFPHFEVCLKFVFNSNF